jgi:hypothetical protein
MKSREHVPYYERTIEQQQLDALLRIEDILARAFPAPAPKPVADPVEREDVFDLDGHKVGSVPKAKRK